MNSPVTTPITKIKLLAVMEAKTVTGAAKNMLDFCRSAREFKDQHPDATAIETAIVTFERGRGERANEFVRAAQELGIEVDIIEERRRFDLSVIPALRQIVERRAPDIVLTHHVKSHFLMRCSRLWQRTPWIAFHHGYTQTLFRERFYNRLDRLSLPSAHRVVTVCRAFARDLMMRAGVTLEQISVLHNSIRAEEPRASAEEARALRARLGIGDDERMLLAIGRLSSEKAHIDLIHAFRYLLESQMASNARLVIVGDGPERGRLEGAARSSGVSERVYFTGQLNDVRAFYTAADMLVLPSHSEGSPYVLLEAMAAGLPVVATMVGGVPEMVEDQESALLVPARNPQAMASAISRLLKDAGLARKLTINATALVATRYSPETYVRSLIEIYLGIISSAASRQAFKQFARHESSE